MSTSLSDDCCMLHIEASVCLEKNNMFHDVRISMCRLNKQFFWCWWRVSTSENGCHSGTQTCAVQEQHDWQKRNSWCRCKSWDVQCVACELICRQTHEYHCRRTLVWVSVFKGHVTQTTLAVLICRNQICRASLIKKHNKHDQFSDSTIDSNVSHDTVHTRLVCELSWVRKRQHLHVVATSVWQSWVKRHIAQTTLTMFVTISAMQNKCGSLIQQAWAVRQQHDWKTKDDIDVEQTSFSVLHVLKWWHKHQHHQCDKKQCEKHLSNVAFETQCLRWTRRS
jgi:hypothetical protein